MSHSARSAAYSVTVFFAGANFSEAKLGRLDRIAARHGAIREAEPVVHCGEAGIEYRISSAAAFGLAEAFRNLRGSDVLVDSEARS